jgi:hypothetical protein
MATFRAFDSAEATRFLFGAALTVGSISSTVTTVCEIESVASAGPEGMVEATVGDSISVLDAADVVTSVVDVSMTS